MDSSSDDIHQNIKCKATDKGPIIVIK